MLTASSSRRSTAITLIALFLLSCVTRAHAHRNHHHHHPRQSIALAKSGVTTTCDFDADVRQDQVTLQSNGRDKTVKIHFGNTRSSQVAFTAHNDDSGFLVAGDIDRDGDVDLIWVGSVDRNNAVVLLNDGEGNFAEAADNSSFAGELDGLFGSNDPSGHQKLTRRHRSSSLVSASFHDVGLPLRTWFQSTTVSLAQVSGPEPLNVQSGFISYLRKRGPPVFLS